MKRCLAFVLVLVLMLGLAACAVETKDVVGTWRRETLYMAYYNCETDMIATFSDDGSFGVVLVDHKTNALLNFAGGTWTLDGEKILAQRGDGAGVMEFAYNSKDKTVEFEGYAFRRDPS